MNVPLASRGPLNLPMGVVRPVERTRAAEYVPEVLASAFGAPARTSASREDVALSVGQVIEQLADLRIEILALRNLVEVGLDLLANGVDAETIAKFLTSQGRFNPATGCRCTLHQRAA